MALDEGDIGLKLLVVVRLLNCDYTASLAVPGDLYTDEYQNSIKHDPIFECSYLLTATNFPLDLMKLDSVAASLRMIPSYIFFSDSPISQFIHCGFSARSTYRRGT